MFNKEENSDRVVCHSISRLFTLPPGTSVKVSGRILKLRNKGGISFAIIYDQGSTVQVVIEGPPKIRIRRGDLITVTGLTQSHSGRIELLAKTLNYLAGPTETRSNNDKLNQTLNPRRIQTALIRASVSQRIHEFFTEREFLPVQSPTLVGDWVVGQTRSFQSSFYEKSCHLAISNMLYHQQILTTSFSRIYELGKLFRQEYPSSPQRLAEFSILDVGMSYANLDDLISIMESLIMTLRHTVVKLPITECSIPDSIRFDVIDYDDVLENAGLKKTSGSQLPNQVRKWLDKNFKSFVWIRGFPEKTRPFFVRSYGGKCFDVQLWYQGKQHVAAGGERETSPEKAAEKLHREGKSPDAYSFYFDTLRLGAPPMVGIGMGLERFLATWITPSSPADFNLFPRYKGRLQP